jgi:uncharacterized protein (DUF1330 family)
VEKGRVVTWLGLEVRDDTGYAQYRAAMTPILASYGGRFEHDFAVARVLKSSASERINRVFAISFPDAEKRTAFYADPAYQRVRAEHYEPAVASAHRLALFSASEA